MDQGIHPNTIRLSIGTEHVDDIIEDPDDDAEAAQYKFRGDGTDPAAVSDPGGGYHPLDALQ